MLNRKVVDIYGWVAVAGLFVMFVLVWKHLVPQNFTMPLFFVAVALFGVRIVLRVMLARQEKNTSGPPPGENGGSAGS